MEEHRVDFITEANYCQTGELDSIVRTIIEKMATVEKLIRLHSKHKKSIEKTDGAKNS